MDGRYWTTAGFALIIGSMQTDLIRQARPADIAAICAAYDELFAHEQSHGSSTNWQPGLYPTAAVPRESVPHGSMYVLEHAGEIRASMVLDSCQAAEYALINWNYTARPEKVLVIHTLCVPPRQAGRGYASRMVRFAQDFARDNGFEVIRIDTWEHNEPAKALYAKLGFTIAGYANAVHHGLYETRLAYLEWQAGGHS